jgi:peptidoglycan hydrolase CwlO-like protein
MNGIFFHGRRNGMARRKFKNFIIVFTILLSCICMVIPIPVSGKVKSVTDVEDKLDGISEEEKKVLEELFTINQKIEELETEKDEISNEIEALQKQIRKIKIEIEAKQKDYDSQLDVLEKVLVNYQRGGPATYLEILLSADNLSAFLKSLNTIKDISHNVNGLLTSLAEGKKALVEEKSKLDAKAAQLEQKNTELSENLHKNQLLQEDKQNYLDQLKENKAYYSEQLDNLEMMWAECQKLFPKLAGELTDTINEGYFSMDDLNMDFGFLNMEGYITEATFNSILQDNSKLTKIIFTFEENRVFLEVPDEHLILAGNFVISGDCAIRFDVEEGSFFGLPLEQASIEELFKNGPLSIDFKSVSEGIITIEFILTKIECEDGRMSFEVKPKW